MVLLNLTTKNLVEDLPDLSQEQKHDLLKHDHGLWKNEAVASALSQRLRGSEDAFTEVLSTLLIALENLINEKSLDLGHTDLVSCRIIINSRLGKADS